MGELRMLVRMRGRQSINALGGGTLAGLRRQHSLFKVFVVLVFGLAFWFGLFALFLEGFHFLDRLPEIKTMIMGILLALFFATLTLMLTFSNGIIAYTSLFRSAEAAFLFSTPVRPVSVFLYKLVDGMSFSSWAFLFMGLPLIFAYGASAHVPWYFYPASVAFFGAFVVIPAALGSTAALLIGAWFSHRPKRVILALLGAAGLLVGLWLLRAYPAFNLRGTQYDLWMRNVLDKLAWTENPFLPSYWIAQGILHAARGALGKAAFYFLVILANSLLALRIAEALARRYYLKAYHSFHGLGGRRRRAREGFVRRGLRAGLWWLRPPLRVMIIKDVTSFLRDPVQWSQALIFFGLIGVYVLNLRSLNYHIQSPEFKNMVAFLNLTATSLTMATFTNRFVFPLLSLEGRRFWVLGLAPLPRSDILLSKFLFAFGGCFSISAVLMMVSDTMLAVGYEMLVLHLFAVLAISAGVSGLAAGLGAIFTNLGEDNPSRIVSGFGGTLNLILSMALVGTVVALLAAPCHMYLVKSVLDERAFQIWITLSLVLTAALSALACVLPLMLGNRALIRLET